MTYFECRETPLISRTTCQTQGLKGVWDAGSTTNTLSSSPRTHVVTAAASDLSTLPSETSFHITARHFFNMLMLTSWFWLN